MCLNTYLSIYLIERPDCIPFNVFDFIANQT